MSKRRPHHAKHFRGKAKNIPEEDLFMLPYQQKWILDEALMKFMEKSRRVGISYGSSYEDVRYHSKDTCQQQTWVSSRDELTARQYVRDCMGFAKILNAAAEDMGEQILEDGEGKRHSIYRIDFANGYPLNSLSSNPDAFAGRGGRVKLDEFALRKDPRQVYAIAGPTIDWGGSLAIISTHRGSANYFNVLKREIVEKGNPKNFSYHRVTLQDALDQFFLWKLQTKLPDGDPRLEMDEADYFDYQRSRAADEETFLQEYMCIPADDATAFIEWSLIDACSYAQGEDWEIMEPKDARASDLYGGVDIGRHHDLTSLTIVEKVAGMRPIRKRIDLQGMSFTRQEEILYPWFEVCRRVCIDATGLGMQFAERAAERFGKYKIEPVTFTAGMKEELAYPVRTAFEDRALRIPFEDDKLKSDIRAIRKEVTSSGNIRFAADRGTNGHADRFWGLALALHAAKESNLPLEAIIC